MKRLITVAKCKPETRDIRYANPFRIVCVNSMNLCGVMVLTGGIAGQIFFSDGSKTKQYDSWQALIRENYLHTAFYEI